MSARRGGGGRRRRGGGAGKDSHDGAISVSLSLSAMVTSQYRFQNNTLYVLFKKYSFINYISIKLEGIKKQNSGGIERDLASRYGVL